MPLRRDSQFHSVALPPNRPEKPRPWGGQGPRIGSLYPPDAFAVAETLRRFTPTPDECWFCLWEGYGLLGRSLTTGPEPDAKRYLVPDNLQERVSLPNRDYLLYFGGVDDVVATATEAFHQTANLWWPSDRSWAVATEIDLSSTYVGGTTELAEALVADTRIEALFALPDDDISRQEDWVQRWTDKAVDDLLGSGDATVETSAGTLYFRVKRPTRLRDGALWTSSYADMHNAGYHRLSRPGKYDIRVLLAAYVSRAVIGLVGE